MVVGVGVPICVECGTRSNPCRCRVIGPTIGLLVFAAAAVHMKGRRIMGHPARVVYPKVSRAVPI
ncbi:hypothetical protein MKW98_020520 [Papaver atlanticum]|uniref:Uncharacterized protein n=1 Tax=Papaver atlanticum TaxID=357466 RepID=A0AAD4XI98_9MAGN|nr:hypothetical protein MKW98_020520 [Papaver atlanticum]